MNRTEVAGLASGDFPRRARPDQPALEQRIETIRNPLDGWASVLALRDLRRRVRASLRNRSRDEAWEEQLLALDPLTVLRCMRIAHAPVYALDRVVLTIPDLCRTLGRPMVRRALDTPAREPNETEDVRRLWLHSLATATAAQQLAITTGEVDPDRAYLLGLLHDLPIWLHYLDPRPLERYRPMHVEAWINHWNLPGTLREVIVDNMLCDSQHERRSSTESSLVAAAELLAELADFWHPGDGQGPSRDLMLSVVTKEDLVAAHNLRQKVGRALDAVGIQANPEEPQLIEADGPTDSLLGAPSPEPEIDQLVLNLTNCRNSTRYRGLVTATTSAAVRHLNFDRVYSTQWSRATGRCFISAKSDMSPRRQQLAMVQPNPIELEAMAKALVDSQPQLLTCDAKSGGLLRYLGSDEALITVINPQFDMPTILVMDRALSGIPIDERDHVGAGVLAGTASLLVETLLLRKERTRAQKYSLTDPLTRLFNRSVGIAALAQEIARAKRTGASLTVLMLDMDDFKKLNDTQGHVAGDHALRTTAEVLRHSLRRSDIVCRYGGEEFLVVLPETAVDEASVLATRVFTEVAEVGQQRGLPLTISIGLSGVRPDTDTVESVLVRADRALYASKSRGRNRFSVDEE